MSGNSKIDVLLIEDENFDVRRVKNTIKPFDHKIRIKETVSNGNAAIKLLNEPKENYDLIIMDFQIAGGIKGEDLIRKIKSIDPSYQIIVVTKMTLKISDFDFAKRLMDAGAFWYCTKYPTDIEDFIYQPTDFLMSILNAYEKRKLEKQKNRSNKKLSKNIEETLNQKVMIGESASTKSLQEQIKKYSQRDVNILINGPSGTGKELVANNIHYRGRRKFENFVPINCGGIPRELLESELFGYEKGAFTGAVNSKAGLFEIADKGTIFLDEVGEIPLNAQVKLLRVIQEGEVEKIGRTDRPKVDVRIIAATNKNLEEEVRNKRFREDLYYRLNVIPIYILPLSQRVKDIIPLIEHYSEYYSQDMGRKVPRITEEALELLQEYEWPGNVRELKNVVQRLLLNAEDEITISDVKTALQEKSLPQNENFNETQIIGENDIIPLREMEKRFRKEYFKYVRKNSRSDADAAYKLGLAPPNYYRMSRELGLK